jgi:hypothetical protein
MAALLKKTAFEWAEQEGKALLNGSTYSITSTS